MDQKDNPLELGPAADERPVGAAEQAHRDLSYDELASQLRGKKQQIKARIDALEDEVLTTGQSIKAAVTRHPLAGVGIAVASGLLVGLLFGGRRGKKGTDAHRALVDRYLDTLVQDVRRAVASGKDAGEAVHAALEDRIPLIVYTPGAEEGGSPGVIRQTFDLAVKTALGFAVKTAMDLAASRLDVTRITEGLTVTQTEDAAGENHTEATMTRTVEKTEE